MRSFGMFLCQAANAAMFIFFFYLMLQALRTNWVQVLNPLFDLGLFFSMFTYPVFWAMIGVNIIGATMVVLWKDEGPAAKS